MRFYARCKSYKGSQLNSFSKFTLMPQIFTRSRQFKRSTFCDRCTKLAKAENVEVFEQQCFLEKIISRRRVLGEIYLEGKTKQEKTFNWSAGFNRCS